MENEFDFEMEMEVRDYELDTEHIVNNANYLHYMEHTRHKFCAERGVSFIELQKRGIVAVVHKIEIEYISSLRSGDVFRSALRIVRRGPRFIFHQEIFAPSGKLATRADVTCVMLENGRPSRGDEVARLFGI